LGNFQRVSPRKLDGRSNIGGVRRLYDDRRAPVDHGIPDLARFVVIGIVRSQYPAFDRTFYPRNRFT
jgi:hypothetical protein